MGTAWNCEPVLIRLSLIDYFTCETLIDSLVSPRPRMHDYNTKWSGVTRDMMNDARRNARCIKGVNAARAEVWKFVGPDTVVMMHGGAGDMVSLRWIHKTVIDTRILVYSTKEPLKGSLKYLAKEILGRKIQQGKHSSHEDSLACRDLVAWHLGHSEVSE